MPIHFQNMHPSSDPTMSAKTLTDWVRNKFNLPGEAAIAVGASITTVRMGKVSVQLPFGVKDVKNNSFLPVTMKDFTALMGQPLTTGTQGAVPLSTKNHVPISPDLPEEEWVDAVVGTLFPGHQPLHACQQLYQTVPGTSGGSVYRTAFIGPHIKGACRIKGNSVSFRFTTDQATCPDGELKDILEHLGVTKEYEDRMTGHASLPAPYKSNPGPTRALFGAFYGALRPFLTSPFPDLNKFAEGTS